MKWVLSLLFFVVYYGFSQPIPIIDYNFKYKLLQASETFGVATNFLGDPITIDVNHNGEIEVEEAQTVFRLFIPTSNITNLSGIENFTNLVLLQCAQNNITNINLQQLIHLEHLSCYQNQISSLNLNTLPNLKNLFCYNNQLSSLEFNNNPILTVTYCGNNQLSSLDFSNNPLFRDLGCKNNPNLTILKINNGSSQIFGPTTWLNECWSGTNITTICADSNEIIALQTYLTSCGVNTNNITISSNCSLSVKEYNDDSVNIYPNPSNGLYIINIKNDAKLIIHDFLGKVLLKQDVSSDLENTFDLTNYATGIYFAKITDNNNNSKIVKLIKK